MEAQPTVKPLNAQMAEIIESYGLPRDEAVKAAKQILALLCGDGWIIAV